MSSISDINLDQYKSNNYSTHSLHPYPAKFIPQIPSLLIERFSKESGQLEMGKKMVGERRKIRTFYGRMAGKDCGKSCE